MSRKARLVYPNVAYHVCQRGNRRMQTFFNPEDYERFLALLQRHSQWHGLDIEGYVFMTNHFHLVCRPKTVESLSRAIGTTTKTYAEYINHREGWTGSLWQGRYYSAPFEDAALADVMAYVERNPVRAGLVQSAAEWRWSSARAHVLGEPDSLLGPRLWPFDGKAWQDMLVIPSSTEDSIRTSLRQGRPLGSEAFVQTWERRTGLVLRPQRPGRKLPRHDSDLEASA